MKSCGELTVTIRVQVEKYLLVERMNEEKSQEIKLLLRFVIEQSEELTVLIYILW